MSNERKLGLLLTTSPEHASTHTLIKLAEAALRKGVEVRIFLMCDGVLNVNHVPFLSLIDSGAKICLCQQNLNERFQDEVDGITLGSQYDLERSRQSVPNEVVFGCS